MEEINFTTELKNFLDAEGKLKSYPSKKKPKILSLYYLASKFELDKIYAEKDVNQILKSWHTFSDPATLRRELIENHFLGRKPDCTAYWLEKEQPTLESFELK